MNKKELRQKYKALRNQLSEDNLEEMSLAIANKLLTLPIWEKNYFHIFLPITEQKEVNTEFILHLLSGKDKEIIISKSNFSSSDSEQAQQTREMTHFLLTDNTKIKKNQYNIPEPVGGLEVPTSKIEVVFVPLLAFDKSGHRVGYGKGFYDKFLKECNPDTNGNEPAKQTIKIGLSCFEAEEQIEDVFENDVKLDYCVTPNEVYQFSL
jgi:5-formyltetrahydrofolate cyclo-ligase